MGELALGILVGLTLAAISFTFVIRYYRYAVTRPLEDYEKVLLGKLGDWWQGLALWQMQAECVSHDCEQLPLWKLFLVCERLRLEGLLEAEERAGVDAAGRLGWYRHYWITKDGARRYAEEAARETIAASTCSDPASVEVSSSA